jgi:putative photosynthetic complex assembly protein
MTPWTKNPTVPLTMAALVIGATLAIVGPGKFAGPATDPGVPAQMRDLRFDDRADGSVVVTDAREGAVLQTYPSGDAHFIRGALRALTRERRMEELGRDAPFTVARWPDGRITLQDAATGRSVELLAFGVTQAEAFARFLPR